MLFAAGLAACSTDALEPEAGPAPATTPVATQVVLGLRQQTFRFVLVQHRRLGDDSTVVEAADHNMADRAVITPVGSKRHLVLTVCGNHRATLLRRRRVNRERLQRPVARGVP